MNESPLVNYDLYLIAKHLKNVGFDIELPDPVPIGPHMPGNYRVYFATSRGEVIAGFDGPGSTSLLFTKAVASGRKGTCFIFIFRDTHLIEILTPEPEQMALALSAFAGSNVCSPLFQTNLLGTVSLWRERLWREGMADIAQLSDDDLLDWLYRDQS
ncbi:MAG: hypothetical protein QY316_00700 [Thermodesulfobacteriota bacterium]|nr:MAG: hypothetical protein QY316_00700 [Thermodesulfobacteriota bacterium]